MTHEWTDPELPLSNEAREQLVSGVLPSGEANMFDFSQHGKSINKTYPSPEGNQIGEPSYSSVVASFPEDSGVSLHESGIFYFNNLDGRFSSDTQVPSGLGDRLQAFYRPPQGNVPREIYTFRVQDSYIHHKPYDGRGVEILFLSSYNEAIPLDRYGNLDSYYNAGY